MIPLYGFLQGDTVGLLILAEKSNTVAELAESLQLAALVRVRRRPHVEVWYKGRKLEAGRTIEETGLSPLERFDVVAEGSSGFSQGS